jgi:CheY-like chemotaxis protein
VPVRRSRRPLEVLLVEDDDGDVLMVREALAESERSSVLEVVDDGAKALAYLRKEEPYGRASRPDLVLLDLNLPKVSGKEVLSEVKSDPALRQIPVVVLTTSQSDSDIRDSYDRHANAYVTKPGSYRELADVVREIDHFFDAVAQRAAP